MKIVYILNIDIHKESGVLLKVNNQIEEWVIKGHEVHAILLPETKGDFKKSYLTNKVTTASLLNNDFAYHYLSGGFYHILNRTLSAGKLRKLIQKLNPDIVYVREMIGFPGQKALKGFNLVLEANTVLKDEMALASKRIRIFYGYYQPRLYNLIKGFVGVTDEISNTFKYLKKPVITISNGRKLKDFELEKSTLNQDANKRAQIVFVGSDALRWHGVDKYEFMAKMMPEYDFHLIGPKATTEAPDNLIVHGFLSQQELSKIYSFADIAIGSLALHRNNMEEACPLKVREYASYGLPMIIAYKDTDFSGQDFVLQLENKEDSIATNIDKINLFIQQWKGKRVPKEKIEALISLEVKEIARLQFFEHVLKN